MRVIILVMVLVRLGLSLQLLTRSQRSSRLWGEEQIFSKKFPRSPKEFMQSCKTRRLIQILAGATVGVNINKGSFLARATQVEAGVYVDNVNGFSVDVPVGWIVLPKKDPSTTLTRYRIEDVLFVASNFVEGASFSITRTDARRLLKDFNIDWWFGPLDTIGEVGNAVIISELLLNQRQANFEKKEIQTEIINAKINDTDQSISFEFKTSLAEEVYRKTAAKGIKS